MNFMWIALLLHFAFCTSVCLASIIQLEKNGYSGILVAISDKVPESQRLIANLEDFFEGASAVLYKATRGEAYFQEITIIAPINWTLENKEHRIFNNENAISISHIIIDEPHPAYGDDPFTMQPGACGDPGFYIRFSADMFKRTDKEHITRLIIQHWARFRYGVFEEYSDPQKLQVYPALYMKNCKMFPSTCTAKIPGWFRSEKRRSSRCSISQGKVVDECMFYADNADSAPQVKASLMSYVCRSTVNYFCDNTPERMHNRFAPSKHNEMCNYRSTWEVVSKHDDFTHVSPWPAKAPSPSPPKTKFVWKKIDEIKPKFILLLDISGSMSLENRLTILKAAAIRFFKDLLPSGSYTGVVTFQSRATKFLVVYNATDAERNSAAIQISKLFTVGYTAIGTALLRGFEHLDDSKTDTEGVAFILVSDGEESKGTMVQAVYDKIRESRVIIHSLALGREASDLLEGLASSTGGRTYFFDTKKKNIAPGAVDLAFLEIIRSQLGEKSRPVLVMYKQENVTELSASYKFSIDEELGINTLISVIPDLSTNAAEISVVIHGPNGETYSRSPEQDTDNKAGRVITRIADAQKGEWKVVVTKVAIRFMNLFVMVISHRRPETERDLVLIRGWLSSLEVNITKLSANDSTKMPLRIFVDVNQGFFPVINATVIATVAMPNEFVSTIKLLDNGIGSDVVKHDGIYSAYFLNFTDNGRYPVSVEVRSRGETKLRIPTKKFVTAYEKCDRPEGVKEPSRFLFSLSGFDIENEIIENDTEESFPTEKVDSFRGFVEIGSFKVLEWFRDWKRNLAPHRVTDLKVVATSIDNDSLSLIAKLSWTTPGNHFDEGKPSMIELRGHNDSIELRLNFSEATKYSFPQDVRSPLTDPEQAGFKVTINVVVPLDKTKVAETRCENDMIVYEFFFALKAFSNEGIGSEVSNIATAHFSENWEKSWDIIDAPEPLDDEWPLNVWYLSGFGVMSIILAIVLYECISRFWCKSGRDSSEREDESLI